MCSSAEKLFYWESRAPALADSLVPLLRKYEYSYFEGGTRGKFLRCPLKGKWILCFNFGGRHSDLHGLRSRGFRPNTYNPVES